MIFAQGEDKEFPSAARGVVLRESGLAFEHQAYLKRRDFP